MQTFSFLFRLFLFPFVYPTLCLFDDDVYVQTDVTANAADADESVVIPQPTLHFRFLFNVCFERYCGRVTDVPLVSFDVLWSLVACFFEPKFLMALTMAMQHVVPLTVFCIFFDFFKHSILFIW